MNSPATKQFSLSAVFPAELGAPRLGVRLGLPAVVGETSWHRSTVPGALRFLYVVSLAATVCLLSAARVSHLDPNEGLPMADAFPVTIRRPLVNLNTACAAMDCHPDAIRAFIEDGRLPWAFNIASELRTQREIRILSRCLSDLQSGQTAAARALEFSAVLQLIFPMMTAQPFVVAKLTADTVSRQFNCDTDLVLHLVKKGWLRVIGAKARRGPGGSPFIQFQSVVNFLKQRRVT